MMVHSAKAYMVVFPILGKVELCTTMKKKKKYRTRRRYLEAKAFEIMR